MSQSEGPPSRTFGHRSVVVSDRNERPSFRPAATDPGEKLCRFDATDERIRGLVERFLDESAGDDRDNGLTIRLRLVEDDLCELPESLEEHWSGTPTRLTVRVGDHLETTIDVGNAVIDGWVSESLLDRLPETAARLLLEAPLATARAGRGWQVVHAATVVGPSGAAVIRGASGSGKSTLAAAAWKAGLEVLGDESVLVRQPGHHALVASVREVLVRPETAEMLDLEGDRIVTNGGEPKLRLILHQIEAARRSATHAATVFLGDRSQPGGARSTPLSPEAFKAGFDDAAIPQERWYGSPKPLVDDWARRPAFRLDGAIDLDGAIALLRHLCHGETR